MWSDVTYCSHIGLPYVLWFLLVENEIHCIGSWMFFHPWDKCPSLLQLSGCIPVHPSWLGICVPTPPCCFAEDVVWRFPHCDCLFFGVYTSKIVCAYLCLYFFCCFHWKHFRCIFESCHMVDFLSTWSGIIFVCNGSVHSNITFWCLLNFWDHMGPRFWCIRFYHPNFHFWLFALLLL